MLPGAPPVLTPRRWPIDRIVGHSTVEVRDLDVGLNAGLLLAAFVMPNDPAIEAILKEAAQVLLRAGKSDSLNGYADGSATRVWEVASAVWSAVAATPDLRLAAIEL